MSWLMQRFAMKDKLGNYLINGITQSSSRILTFSNHSYHDFYCTKILSYVNCSALLQLWNRSERLVIWVLRTTQKQLPTIIMNHSNNAPALCSVRHIGKKDNYHKKHTNTSVQKVSETLNGYWNIRAFYEECRHLKTCVVIMLWIAHAIPLSKKKQN